MHEVEQAVQTAGLAVAARRSGGHCLTTTSLHLLLLLLLLVDNLHDFVGINGGHVGGRWLAGVADDDVAHSCVVTCAEVV